MSAREVPVGVLHEVGGQCEDTPDQDQEHRSLGIRQPVVQLPLAGLGIAVEDDGGTRLPPSGVPGEACGTG